MSVVTIDKAMALLKFGAQAMNDANFEEAERAFREASDIAQAAGNERVRARALARWHYALAYQGRMEEARKPIIEAFTSAITNGKDIVAIIILHSNALRFLPTDHPQLAEDVKTLMSGAMGFPQDLDVARALGQIAIICNAMGDKHLAAQLLERALPVLEAGLGGAHPEVAMALGNLADVRGVLTGYRDFAKLEPMFRRAIAIQSAALAPEHPERVPAMMTLGLLIARNGRYDEGRQLLNQALEIAEKVEGRDGGTPQAIRSALGQIDVMLLDAKAEAYLRQAVEAAARQPAKPLEHGLALVRLCRHYFARRKPKAAEPYYRTLRSIAESLGEMDQIVISAEIGVPSKIYVMMNEGRSSDAENVLLGELETMERVLPAGHAEILGRLYFLGNFYRMLGMHKEALRQFERYVAGIPQMGEPARLDGLARVLDAQLELGRRKEAERTADEIQRHTGRRPVMDAGLNQIARELDNVWLALGLKESQDLIGAALEGDPGAGLVVGLCYAAGQGVPADIGRAKPWFDAAAKAGNQVALKIQAALRGGEQVDFDFELVARAAQIWAGK